MLHLFMVYPEIITSRQVDEWTSGRVDKIQVDEIQVDEWTRYE